MVFFSSRDQFVTVCMNLFFIVGRAYPPTAIGNTLVLSVTDVQLEFSEPICIEPNQPITYFDTSVPFAVCFGSLAGHDVIWSARLVFWIGT